MSVLCLMLECGDEVCGPGPWNLYVQIWSKQSTGLVYDVGYNHGVCAIVYIND